MIQDVISYGGHVFGADYRADFVAGTQPRLSPYKVDVLELSGAFPVVSGLERKANKLMVQVVIENVANVTALRSQLFRWFDPEDETPKKLLVNSTSGSLFAYAITEEFRMGGTPAQQNSFVATLAVDGDGRWQNDVLTSGSWGITASGQTKTIANNGEDDAYPVYTFKPTSAKGGSYAYRRWIPILWPSTYSGYVYPVVATLNTSTLVSGSLALANGDDLRVLVDGVEVYRWLDSMNSASTKIWFNASFVGSPSLTLKTAIAGAGDVDSIEFNEDISSIYDKGILYIGTEAFVYSARNVIDKNVSGVERAAKGTSMGAHSINDAVYWIQHDTYIVYGDPSASAPYGGNYYKPVFNLNTSSNTSWVYQNFRWPVMNSAASWNPIGPITIAGSGGCYSGSLVTLSDSYTTMGIWIGTKGALAFGWQLFNPCGITNVTWTNGVYIRTGGEALITHTRYWVRGGRWWTDQYSPANPANDDEYYAWSYSGAAFAASNQVALQQYFGRGAIEINDVTVTLSPDTPTLTVGVQQGNYHLQGTLTNQTTGESFTLDFVMDVNSELEVDTENKTVTWLLDGSRQMQALTLSQDRTGSGKRAWLRLQPGNNVLRFDDTATGNLTLTTQFRERYY